MFLWMMFGSKKNQQLANQFFTLQFQGETSVVDAKDGVSP